MAPNISEVTRENAKIVKTRKNHVCLLCNRAIKKGVRAKTYYIKGLGAEYFCTFHRKEDIVLEVWDLLGVL